MEALQEIGSRDNQHLKLARGLKNKKVRSESGCFLLEGLRLAEEALSAAWPLRLALVGEAALAQPRLAAVVEALLAQGCPVYRAPQDMIEQAAATDHSQGLLLLAYLPKTAPALAPTADFLIVADQISDPGNLGAIMRSAWAAGADGLLLTPGCADPFNPKVVRASMGGLLRLPVLTFADDESLYSLLKKGGWQLLAAAAEGACRYNQADLRPPLAWLLGAEATGLSTFWRKAAHSSVYLPMAQGAESLNVAAAAAVLFYETAAQRGFPKSGQA